MERVKEFKHLESVGGNEADDKESDSSEEEDDEIDEDGGGYKQLPFEPVLVGGDAEVATGYEQAKDGGGVGNLQAYSGAALGDMQADAGGADGNGQFVTGAAAANAQAYAAGADGNVEFFAGATAGNAHAVAGAADGNMQLFAGGAAGNAHAVAGAPAGDTQVAAGDALPTRGRRTALPGAHHATMYLLAEIDDMHNTMSILHENQASLTQVEQERDALREEVSVLHTKIRLLQSKSIDGVEVVDFDDPQIDVEKLPKVDGKIHIPTILSDDEVFTVRFLPFLAVSRAQKNVLHVYVVMMTAGPAAKMQFYPEWADMVPLMVRKYYRLGVCKDLYYFVAGGDAKKEAAAMDKIANKRQTMNKTFKLYGCGAGGGVSEEKWPELKRVGLNPTTKSPLKIPALGYVCHVVEWPMAHRKGRNSPSLDTVELNNRNSVTEKTAVCVSWLNEWLEREPGLFKADVPPGFEMGTAFSGKDELKVRILIEGWEAFFFPSGVPLVDDWPPA
ncbi:unnamed protein product [Closterium sp. Yama58-4]|nr:unnamed protein product [Closterium sp. Yama58-4]